MPPQSSHGGSDEEALTRLRAALAQGPAMLGPLDFGYLSYHRGSAGMAGFDHYLLKPVDPAVLTDLVAKCSPP